VAFRKMRVSLVHSFSRWLSGLRPEFGSDYLFRRFVPVDLLPAVESELGRFRDERRCPFCGTAYAKPANMYRHLVEKHGDEIWGLLERLINGENMFKDGPEKAVTVYLSENQTL